MSSALPASLNLRGEIFHTYSAYARGLDQLDFAYSFLDMTALGRQEGWKSRTTVSQ